MDDQEREEMLAALGDLHAAILRAHSLASGSAFSDDTNLTMYELLIDAETQLIRIVKWVDPRVGTYGSARLDRFP